MHHRDALPLCHTIQSFNNRKKWPVENIVAKEENVGKQYFSFPHENFCPINHKFKHLVIISLLSEKNPHFGRVIFFLSRGKELTHLAQMSTFN